MNLTNSIRAVIFDLDGTLVETGGEIATALRLTFEELRLAPLARAQVEALVGRGVRSLVERALAGAGAADKDVDVILDRFEAHYATTVGTEAVLYPGALEGMRRLQSAGLAMSVVTNKPRHFTQRLLDGLGVSAMLAGVVAGDDGLPRKPRGDMLSAACERMGTTTRETLMLGDSDNDVEAARAAGCPVWCVPYGYNEGRPPQALACDRLVPDIDAAARLLLGA